MRDDPRDFKTATLSTLEATRSNLCKMTEALADGAINSNEYATAAGPLLAHQLALLQMLAVLEAP